MSFGVENDLLLVLLRNVLTDCKGQGISEKGRQEIRERIGSIGEECNWEHLRTVAQKHGVLPLLYPLCEGDVLEEGTLKDSLQPAAVSAAKQSYRLLFLSKYLVEQLQDKGVCVVLLKGAATADFYPVPEYRKSGDVDLLLTDGAKMEVCREILESCGCKCKASQDALHHVSFVTEDGIEIEIHTLMAEPFDNRRMNRYLDNLIPTCAGQIKRAEIMGVTLPVLKDGYHAYELLLHMLQHFLRAGFGLKLLCDWVVFWNSFHERKECELYHRLVTESGLKGFSDMITGVCCEYLGLDSRNAPRMESDGVYDTAEFMREVLEAEEFGRSHSERMVALRGNTVWDYVREFHHQMQLRFPNAGKCFLCWPLLWVKTYIIFVKNNRKIRNVSTKAIVHKAGQRGKLIQQMRLWKH